MAYIPFFPNNLLQTLGLNRPSVRIFAKHELVALVINIFCQIFWEILKGNGGQRLKIKFAIAYLIKIHYRAESH